MNLLDGTVVEVRTTLWPPIVVDLGAANGPPGLLSKVARPRIIVSRNGAELVNVAPQGAPEDAPPWGFLVVAALAVLLALLALR